MLMFPYATYFVALSVGQKLMLFGGFGMEKFGNPCYSIRFMFMFFKCFLLRL